MTETLGRLAMVVVSSDVDYDPNGGIAAALLALLNCCANGFLRTPRNDGNYGRLAKTEAVGLAMAVTSGSPQMTVILDGILLIAEDEFQVTVIARKYA